MKHLKLILLSFLALLLVGIFSCEKEPTFSDQDPHLSNYELGKMQQMKQPKDCFKFRVVGTDIPLGCAWVPDEAVPFSCPGGFNSFGAKSFPITIGDYEGYMSSVVTSLDQSGNGALHLNLVHYFYSEYGSWWTEDQAVCAPVKNDPTICLVNDVLNIVGGKGIFEGISGKFHNHGLLHFDGGGEACPNCFGLDPGAFTGSIDFEIFGQICVPNLGPV